MKRLLLLLTGVLALTFVAACSDDDPEPTSMPTATPTVTASPEPSTPTQTPTSPAIPTATPTAEPTGTPGADDMEAGAIGALSGWISVPADEITVRRVVEETWPNGCMGVEISGSACTEAITPGFIIELMIGDNEGGPQLVHTDGQGNYVWAPAFSPNVVELTAVDVEAGTITFEMEIIGGTSRAVDGTHLGVPLEELEAGDSVEVAITYAVPGEDEALIVWLAPVE
jgi:hypothetical protein